MKNCAKTPIQRTPGSSPLCKGIPSNTLRMGDLPLVGAQQTEQWGEGESQDRGSEGRGTGRVEWEVVSSRILRKGAQ